MTIEISEKNNDNVEFAGTREPNERDLKLGCESIVVVAKDELPDDSYVYVEKEGKDRGENRVYGKSIGKDLRADGSAELIEIVALEGVAGDSAVSNSDGKRVEMKGIECVGCEDDVSGSNQERAESNSDNAVHNEKEIESPVTVNTENGISVSYGRAYETELESNSQPNAEDVSDVRLDETESESPVFVNHSTESNDGNTDSNFCEIAESESPVFVNYGDELNDDILGLNSDESKQINSSEPTENTLELGAEGGDEDSDGRFDLRKEKMEQPLAVNHGVDGDPPASDEMVMQLSKTESVEYANEIQCAGDDVQSAEAGSVDSDGQVEKGKEMEGSLCVNNGEGVDPNSDATLNDAPQIENLESGNKIRHAADDAGDVDFNDQVEEKKKMEFTVPDNHDGGRDPCSDDMVNEVPQIQSIDPVHEIQQLHAEDSLLNAEAGDVDSNCQVDEREQMEPPVSVNHDGGGDPCSNSTVNEVPKIMFAGSVDEVQQLQVEVQNAHGGDVDSSSQMDEENEKMELPVFGNDCNKNGDGHPSSDDMVNEVLEFFNEIQQLPADGDVQTAESLVDEVKITESTVEDDLLQSCSECRDLNVDDRMSRTKEIDSPSPAFSNGVPEAEAKDGVLIMDDGGNIEKDTVTVLMNDVIGDDTENKTQKDMVERKDEIQKNGTDSVCRVLHKGLRVDEPIDEKPEALPVENMEGAGNFEVADVAAESQIHLIKNGDEKEMLQNANVVENVEFYETEVISNMETARGDSCTVQAGCESAFTNGSIVETVAIESAKVNPEEDSDVIGDKYETIGAKDSESIGKAAEISEEIQPNGRSISSAVNSALVSSSELDEKHQLLPIKSSKKLIPVSLPKDSRGNDNSLPVVEDFSVNKGVTESGITNSSTGFKLRAGVHLNSVSQSNLEVPLVFGSFVQVITTNGISTPPLEGSNASSASSQLEDTNGTVSNDKESNCSASSSPLGKEVASSFSAFDAKKVDVEAGRKPVYAIVRIPRPIDNSMKEQIRQAQVLVDELTQKRDTINALVQKKQVARQEIIERLRAARSPLKVAKDAELAKRKQLDSMQSIMNKMKTATSVEEHDERILSIQRRIEHETVPLKEEKQLIRAINQLKRARDNLSLDMRGQSDLQEAFGCKEEIEGNLKILEQEFSSLRKELSQADSHIKSIDKELSDLDQEIAYLRSQVASANNVRQEAYLNLKNLKQQEYERNKPFYQNRRDIQMAYELAKAKDLEALAEHCSNQRERVMELWNKNPEFRREYIRTNEMSILRRFGTLDGRHLGPDEEPPVLRRRNENDASSVPKLSLVEKGAALAVSTTELLGGGKSVIVAKAEAKCHGEKLNQKSLSSKIQKTSKLTVTESTPSASGREEREEETKQEEKKPSEEELQRLREEEERRKEEEAVRLKEKHRKEEIAKAKEAQERKRRNAEKAKARAEARERKLAEEKEKEREKRSRKKAAAAAAALTDVGVEGVPASSSNYSDAQTTSTPDTEVKEKNEAAVGTAKRPATARSYLMSKTSKPKSLVPPPLRKNRRRMQPWIYGIIGSLVILLLIFVVQRFYF